MLFTRKYEKMKWPTLAIILLCAGIKIAFRSIIMYGFMECFRRFGLCSTVMGSVLAFVASYGITRFVMLAAKRSFWNTYDDTPAAVADFIILGHELLCRVVCMFSKKRRVSH